MKRGSRHERDEYSITRQTKCILSILFGEGEGRMSTGTADLLIIVSDKSVPAEI